MAEHEFAGLRCSEVADLAPAFVLGALEPGESDAVRRHLAECPEMHPVFAELNSVVPALFEIAQPVQPQAGLKDRILAAAAADLPAGAPVDAATSAAATDVARGGSVAAPAPVQAERPDRVPSGRSIGGWTAIFRRPLWAGVAAVAVIVALALGAWNIQLQDRVAGLSAYRDGVVQLLDEAAKPGAQLAVLASEGGGPSGLAAVGSDGRISLVMRDLAATSGTQVYQAWVIGGDGTPVPVGDGFAVGPDGTATFVTVRAGVEQGVTVALTLEPQRGAKAPTLPIIAAGKAQSQAS